MDARTRTLRRFLFATSLTLSLLAAPGSAQQNTQQKAQPKKTEARPADGESEEHEGDDVRRREEWFYRQRRFPLGRIPGGARQRALDRQEEMRQAQREAKASRGTAPAETAAAASGSAAAVPLAPSTTMWTHVGPMPAQAFNPAVGFVAGRVSAIAVDPTNANTVFVGGAQGGVWKSTDGGTTWATTFDGSNSLAIGSIGIDPSNPSNIYVGTGEQNFSGDSYYGAGIYKSTNGGATWNPTLNLISGCSTQIGAACNVPTSFIKPAAPFNQIVGGARISSIVVHPSKPMKIFAAVQIFQNVGGGAFSGVYCSDDAGDHWTQVIGGAIGTDIQIHPANIAPGGAGSVGYAALGSPNGDSNPADITGQNGVYKSMNANAACTAQTWTLASTGAVFPQGLNAGLIRIGVAPSDTTAMTVYAAVTQPFTATNSSDNLLGFFKTTNGGTSWTQITLPTTGNPPVTFCVSQCSYDLVVKVHPNSANTIILGGSRFIVGSVPNWVLASTDGGATWNQIALDSSGTRVHVDQHALAFGLTGTGAPKMYVGNDGGIWSTGLPAPGSAITASSVLWSNLNNGLEMIQFYPGLSIHPASNQIAYAGTQDNGTEKMDPTFNAANPLEWSELLVCGDGGYTAIDPSVPSTVYAACQDINIQRSINDGASFSSIDGSILQSDRHEFIAPLVIDPLNPQTLYFGTFRVWQTMNGNPASGATTWSAISPDLTSGVATGDDITSISISPKNSDVVYVGTFGSGTSGTILQRTTNANLGTSATWTPIAPNTLPPRAITQVAGDPNNQDVVFVTMSGFNGFLAGDTQGHVFKCSFVAPVGCTDISTGLPNIPVNAIVVDPMDAGSKTIYIGTDVGVFGTRDGGNTWIVDFPGAPNGLPNIAVLGMALHPTSRVLRIVTHGRSAWDLQLPGLPTYGITSISPATAATGTASLVLTVNGNGFSGTSMVLFNNVVHAPATQTATQLSVNLAAADLMTPAVVNVQVSDPAQPAVTTNTLPFTITTPVPTVTSIAPTSTAVNAAVANMVITGTNFITSSVVRINNNGGSISDTLTPSSVANGGMTINVTIPATAQSVQNAGTYFISVFNPPPGGGDSSGGTQVPPNFTVTPASSTPPPNDNFANAINAGTNAFTDTQNSVNATTPGTDPLPSCVQGIAPPNNPANNGTANSIWYSFTATGPGNVEADTMGSLDDTIIDVVTGAPGSFTEVACNDDINPGVVRTSMLNFTAVQGTTYFFMVSSFQGFGGKVIFNLNTSIAGPTDFTFSPNTPNPSQTVTRPQSASTTITLSPNIALFPGPVTFKCTGLPTESTCMFSPPSVAQNAGRTQVTVTVTTTAPSSVLPVPRRSPPFGLLLWALAGLTFVGLLAARRTARSWSYALPIALILIFAGLAMSCGGGGGGGVVVHDPGSLPLGANNVNITATSGNVMHSVVFKVTLQ